MPLTVVIPPGTISVVPGTEPQQIMAATDVPSFNWTSSGDIVGGLLQNVNLNPGLIGFPGPQTLRVASQVAQDAVVNPPARTLLNSTYT
jgi:hypothetical protein